MAKRDDPASVDRDAAFVQANLRWNFLVLSLDYGMFGLGLSLAASTTVLPAFAQRLGASNLVIGLLPALLTVGWGLPSVFFANYIERLERKLPLVLAVTVWERLPYLFLGLAALYLAEGQPMLTLALMLFLVALGAFSGGAIMPAWVEIVAKVIPVTLRGRYFAFGNIVSGLTGVGGAVLAGYFLGSYAYPLSYALCFFATFAALAVSFAFLAATREHPVPSSKPAVPFAAYLRRLPDVLRHDRTYSAYLVARMLTIWGAMSTGFFTVFALRRLGAGEEQVAVFTFFLLAAQTVATALWGQLSDQRGHKVVLTLGAAAGLVANLVALLATEVWVMYLVFVAMAAAIGAVSVSHMNIIIEFSPPPDRPTYIGLGGTIAAPFSLLAPIVGGLLADGLGFRVVFAVAAAFSLLSFICLAYFVREPRDVYAAD